MGTTPPLTQQPTELVRGPEDAAAEINEEGLVPSPPALEHEPIKLWPPVARLPVELEVAVPVREFRVHNLINLEKGQVIESLWGLGEDMPLGAGDVQLAWTEFEVVDSQLAVRVTRLV